MKRARVIDLGAALRSSLGIDRSSDAGGGEQVHGAATPVGAAKDGRVTESEHAHTSPAPAPAEESREEPCVKCGEVCSSQDEFVELNDGARWPMCSGCDPSLRDDEDVDHDCDVAARKDA